MPYSGSILKLNPRGLELWFAYYALWFGAWIAAPWQSMAPPSLAIPQQWAPEWAWGAFLIFSGLQHLYALRINGSRWWTPLWRIWAVSWSAACVLLLAYGIALTAPGVTGVGTYIAILGCAFYCIKRAVGDLRHSLEVRRIIKEGLTSAGTS